MHKTGFSDFALSPELQKAIAEMGFVEPMPIQARAIGPILQGADIIGQAQTGTGKTAAFGIPILERVAPGTRGVQALILCPTRELAVQIAAELKLLGQYKSHIHILPIYGGQPIERQLKALNRGVQVVVGTPGRILDHMQRKTLRFDGVQTVVLDEADKMFDMGFIDEVSEILAAVSGRHQTLLFSATIPKEVLAVSQRFQREPEFIRVSGDELTVPEIQQKYLVVKEQQKAEVLARLIDIHDLKRILVFCNTKRRVDELTRRLQAMGYAAAGLHGDMKQNQRDRVMGQFRSGRLPILVATDVAARGIDVADIEVVVNYDVPRDEENYVHRVGRTARAGKHGRAFTFVYGKDQSRLVDIQEYANTTIDWQPLPPARRSGEKGRKFPEGRAVRDSERASAPTSMARLFLGLGREQLIGPGDIVGAIAGETDLPGRMIGAIQIHDRFSFVEVPQTAAASVLAIMNRCQIKGHPVYIKPAQEKAAQNA